MFCLLFVSLFKWQLFTFSLEVCRRGDGFTDGTRDKRGLGFTETCSLCYITLFLFRYRNILLSKKHAWTTGHVVRLDYNLFIKNNTDSELKVLIKLKVYQKGIWMTALEMTAFHCWLIQKLFMCQNYSQ